MKTTYQNFLKIGKDKYRFKGLVNSYKKEMLENHEQKSLFRFKSAGPNLYKWYVK